MKVLVATEKPFAKVAVDGIREVVEKNGYELALLEKYTDVNDFYAAVADADALIVRSDKVTKEVIDHAKNLKIVVRAGAGFDNLDLEADFMAFAKERGMVGIKGHRSVGGFRASLYNACPIEAVEALVQCMQDFEKANK